jgi:hypothetical protein
MCEILPIREKLSTQNIDFKTDFLLQDYEEPLQSLQPEHFLKIQFVSALCVRKGGLETSRILTLETL